MTTARKFSPLAERGSLGRLDAPVSKEEGESLAIWPLAENDGLLFKEYRPGLCHPDTAGRLDRLIGLSRRLSQADRHTLTRSSCWPVSRVVEGGQTVGVLIPRAPAKFSAALTGVTGVGQTKPLAIDWLANSAGKQRTRGLPPASFEQRLKVCTDLAAVAAIFEKEDIVYGDWSYANAFWSTSDFCGYLIDVDTCEFGSRGWVATPNWEDPLTPQGERVDNGTDRYRLALLLARCLTGERDAGPAHSLVQLISRREGRPVVGEVLDRILSAPAKSARPSVAEVLGALTKNQRPAGAGNVTGWKQVNRARTPQRPAPNRPVRSGPPTSPIPVQPRQPIRHPVQAPLPRPAPTMQSSATYRVITWLVVLAIVALIIAGVAGLI